MRIAVVTKYFPTSAHPWAGHSAYQTLRLLAARHSVQVFYPEARYPRLLEPLSRTQTRLDPDFRVPGVEARYLPYPALPLVSRPFNGASIVRTLLPHLRAYRPEIILNYVIYPDGYAAVRLGERLGVPVVLTAIGSDLNRISDRISARHTRYALRHAAWTTTVSADLLHTARRMGAHPVRSSAILNGCDTAIFHPQDRQQARRELGLEPDAEIVAYVGRLDLRKGLAELVEAAAALRQRTPKLHCYLIGNGPDQPQLVDLAKRLDVQQVIHFVPPCDTSGVALWMAAANAITLPSYNEGCPNVVIEALAAGRPVVATRVGGIPELMDEHSGRLVPARDPKALATALDETLSVAWDPELLAQRHARNWTDVASDLESVLQLQVVQHCRSRSVPREKDAMSVVHNSETQLGDVPQPGPVRLSRPYLLVIVQIPLYRDAAGQLFTNELWQRDLLRHFDYLGHVILACPCLRQEPPGDALPLVYDATTTTLEILELPLQSSFAQSLKFSPAIIARLWSATRRSHIVHTAVAGWPVPMGWFAMPLAKLLRKHTVVVVESAPWRLQPGVSATPIARLRSAMQEYASRRILRNTDLSLFTQQEYRTSLLGPYAARGHVTPASWIDASDILSTAAAERSWKEKLTAADGAGKVIFAGRLTVEKGVRVLLEAMRILASKDFPLVLDILGDGPLKEECDRASAELQGATRIRMLGSLPYGAPFFAALREHAAVIVPSISDEQPRIIFDACSQAVPAIASDTAGLRSCVLDGQTGRLTPPNDPAGLAHLLRLTLTDRDALCQLGLQALVYARSRTHQQMHSTRADLLNRYFGADA